MDYGRPLLADRLAAAYAAGTLRGPARRRFEALLPAHAALRAATRAWEARLMPLTTALAPVQPPARVWSRVEARVDGGGESTSARAVRAGLGASLGFWRALAGFASVAAIALAVLLAVPGPVAPPIVVVLSSTAAVPSGAAAPATFVASISGDGRSVVTRPIIPIGVQPDRALELWALPAQGAPRSLGLISASGSTVIGKSGALQGATGLAVSLEPPGGSPTGAPTGPVLYTGKLNL
jgi:anti-sigma-K factor RskA